MSENSFQIFCTISYLSIVKRNQLLNLNPVWNQLQCHGNQPKSINLLSEFRKYFYIIFLSYFSEVKCQTYS